VKAVLRDNAELINQKDASGAAALHYATFGGYRSVVQELGKTGCRRQHQGWQIRRNTDGLGD